MNFPDMCVSPCSPVTDDDNDQLLGGITPKILFPPKIPFKTIVSIVFTEMVGAFGGGYVADRFGRRKVMLFGYIGYGLLAIIFGCCPHLWGNWWFSAGYLFLNPGLLAIGSVGFLSLGMRISWTTASATVFTIFMTVSNVAHVLGNKAAGLLVDSLGLSYEQTFIVAGITMFVPLLLLILVRPEQVDRMRGVS